MAKKQQAPAGGTGRPRAGWERAAARAADEREAAAVADLAAAVRPFPAAPPPRWAVGDVGDLRVKLAGSPRHVQVWWEDEALPAVVAVEARVEYERPLEVAWTMLAPGPGEAGGPVELRVVARALWDQDAPAGLFDRTLRQGLSMRVVELRYAE